MSRERWRRISCLAMAGLMATGAPASIFAQTPQTGPKPDPQAPLSSLVAVSQRTGRSIPSMVKRYADQYAKGTLPAGVVFPLPNTTANEVRAITNLQHNVLARWLDPLTSDTSAGAPQFNGNGRSGWLWVNHEYVSNSQPTLTSAPTGQHLTFAKFLRDAR